MNTVLSIIALAAFALLIGAFLIWRKTGDVKKAGLMVLLAVIAVLNIAIWTVPGDDGAAPIDKIGAAENNSTGR